MSPNVIETDPGANYEMADLKDSFFAGSGRADDKCPHYGSATQGQILLSGADDALPELSLSSASIFVEDDVSMCTRGKRCAVLTWGRPELHGLCVFVFHIPKAVPSVMQRRVFFTVVGVTDREGHNQVTSPAWSADQTRLHLFLLFLVWGGGGGGAHWTVYKNKKTMHCWYWGVKKI